MVSGDLHRSTVIFNYCNCTRVSSPPKDSTGINIMQVANIHAMSQRCMTKPEMISTCNSPALFGVHLIASGSTRPDANQRPFAIHKHHLDNRHEQ